MSTDLAPGEVYCRDCGEAIDERAEICPECGIRQREPKPQKPEKNPGLAAVASFIIPGLGQVYNGQIAKGIIAGIVTVGAALTIAGLILAFPLWIWLIYDAYKVAEAGGASSAGGGGSASSPRTTIEQALTWYIDNVDDPEHAKAVRKRFRGTKTSDLSNDEAEYILNAVEEYRRETGRGSTDDVRDALSQGKSRPF